MKRILTAFLITMFAVTSVYAPLATPIPTRWPSLGDKANAILISSNDGVAAKYDWLKSSDRDSKMGALSATNRRTLILCPGTYTITSTSFVMDANFVDSVSLTGNPDDTTITSALADSTVEQTADDVRLSGITFDNTNNAVSTYFAFEINATDNSPSVYRFCNFRRSTEYVGQSVGYDHMAYTVRGTSDIYGLWEFCDGDDGFAWVIASGKKLGATMFYCTAGNYSFGGDLGGEITGTLRHCVGGFGSFGGCDSFGCKVSGRLEYCTGGDNSFALGKELSGIAIGCVGGRNCFAGYHTGANYGLFTGYAKDCIAEGGKSFGMGHASCVQSGILINCRNNSTGGDNLYYTENRFISAITDSSALASLSTSFAGANNDLTFTSKKSGAVGNQISMRYRLIASGSGVQISMSDYVVVIRCRGSWATAGAIKTVIEADGGANALVTVTFADGDGSAVVSEFDTAYLTGGIDKPFWSGNHPARPTACDANSVVYPFDSGHTFTNEGASAVITWSLPAALKGMQYRFSRIDYAANEDVRVDPNGTEHIYLEDGTDVGAGDYRGSDDGVDAYYEITVECFKDGEWRVVDEKGTGASEV